MKVALIAVTALVALLAPTSALAQQQVSTGGLDAYSLLVVDHLHRQMRHPASAHGVSGTVVVKFALDREGNVASSSVAKPSGNDALDQEALATLRRANPFPPFPADKSGSNAWFTAPIIFDGYNMLVYDHLKRHLRYPASAHNAAGTVVVSFVLSRKGNVVSSAVVKPSGNEALDREALTILRRASPFPPFPASRADSQARFAAPITFSP